jgi:glucose-6-phosphate dehydrogenase assembly protein OpcA
MIESYGEPIGAGQSRAPDELTAQFDSGVDLSRINQMLQHARERGGAAQESVFTLNLVAIFFTQQQYDRACEALEAAGRVHPCRLVALIAEPLQEKESIGARVSVVRSGGMITLERIVLTATGRAVRHLESAMMGLLLPELPMVVVWGGRPHGDLLMRAVQSADRIIIDSGARPPTYLSETARLLARGAPIGDLAWARIFPWQAAAAEALDLPNLREHRGRIREARAVCAGAVGAEGLLLLGWMQTRIPRLRVTVSADDNPNVDPERPAATPSTHAAPIALGHVSLFEFTAPPARFVIRREREILLVEVTGDDDGRVVHRVRLPVDAPGRLLGLELNLLSGQDELYAASAQAAARLLTEIVK